MSDWAAQYDDGTSAQARPITVRPTYAGLDLEFAIWPWAEVQQTQGFHSGELVRLQRGSAAVIVPDRRFLLEASGFAPHICQLGSERAALSKAAIVIGSSLAIVIGLIIAVIVGLSWFATRAVAVVPVALEERLGEQVARTLSPGGKTCAAVDAVTTALVRALPENPYTFRVSFVDEPAVNALAAPGGYVIVYRGLLERTSTADELAGVLAHELQHVVQRHSTRGLLRDLGAAAAIGLLIGNTSGAAGMAARLGSLRFQRDDEDEADSKGIELMARAGFDPRAMITMFEKLKRESAEIPGLLQYLSTHPQTAERIARLQARSRELQPARRAAVPGDWTQARTQCR